MKKISPTHDISYKDQSHGISYKDQSHDISYHATENVCGSNLGEYTTQESYPFKKTTSETKLTKTDHTLEHRIKTLLTKSEIQNQR